MGGCAAGKEAKEREVYEIRSASSARMISATPEKPGNQLKGADG
jgi:hypothetical protein